MPQFYRQEGEEGAKLCKEVCIGSQGGLSLTQLGDYVAAFDFGAGGDEHDLVAEGRAGVRQGGDAGRESRRKPFFDRRGLCPQCSAAHFPL